MILVDSSAWIEFYRPSGSPGVRAVVAAAIMHRNCHRGIVPVARIVREARIALEQRIVQERQTAQELVNPVGPALSQVVRAPVPA